jgi:SSS family solute:Na+ symporter/sodium/proline symporter
MHWYLYLILVYILVLMGFNIYRSLKIKGQEDFMVAGRSLSLTVMVFTLVCSWIGSGTFIAGAEYAYYAGWSSLWLPAGAWFGIAIIYFLAAKIRTFGQYTVGDILEVRYGKFARFFGACAIIIAFTTIVSYQFRAGGYILNVVTDGKIGVEWGQTIAAGFVILFTALAGMMAVAYTDLPNGIIILLACCVAVPFVVTYAGGWAHAAQTLPPEHFKWFSADFGRFPVLKALGYCLSTLLLLLGIQSMYQKFYSAKSAKEAKRAVAIWIVGTIVVETVVVAIAIYASSYAYEHNLTWNPETRTGWDPRSMVLQAARHLTPPWVGVLLLGAACAVVLSTGMNYLLSPSTNVIRDIYQRFISPDAPQKKVVAIQKIFVVILGVCAFLMIFIPTVLHSNISILRYSYFAYTLYGVSITPALIAALAWKRASRTAGLVSIISGAVATLFFELVFPRLFPQWMYASETATSAAKDVWGADPFGIPSIFFSFAASLVTLIVVTYLTPAPKPEELEKLFPKKS